jgi:hypothetical protein
MTHLDAAPEPVSTTVDTIGAVAYDELAAVLVAEAERQRSTDQDEASEGAA